MWLLRNGKQGALQCFPWWGFGIFHKGICLFSVGRRDAGARAGGSGHAFGEQSGPQRPATVPTWPLRPRTAKARGSGQAEAIRKIFLNCVTLSCDPAAGPLLPQATCWLLGDPPTTVGLRLGEPLPSPQDTQPLPCPGLPAGAEETGREKVAARPVRSSLSGQMRASHPSCLRGAGWSGRKGRMTRLCFLFPQGN